MSISEMKLAVAPREAGLVVPRGRLSILCCHRLSCSVCGIKAGAGCNRRLGLFKAATTAGEHVQQVTHGGEEIIFLNAAFQAQAFAPQWTGSAVELEKPLSEKFPHFTLQRGKRRSFFYMKRDRKARMLLTGWWDRSAAKSDVSEEHQALPRCEG